MNNDLPLFLCVPTRSQYANNADFNEAYAAHVVKQKAAHELSAESFRSAEADYKKSKTQGKNFR